MNAINIIDSDKIPQFIEEMLKAIAEDEDCKC